MSPRRAAGTLALVGGGEWTEGCRSLDAALLRASGATEVVVLPTAAAFERPAGVAERARAYFETLGVTANVLMALHRTDAFDEQVAAVVRHASFVYLADGSPLHLRSVLKGSPLFEALVAAYRAGAVLAASGAGATLLGDPMVDPRGGAYTVGLGLVRNLAVFPYHGRAAAHLRERSIDLLPRGATLVGIDEATALVLHAGTWRVEGTGQATLYRGPEGIAHAPGATVEGLPV